MIVVEEHIFPKTHICSLSIRKTSDTSRWGTLYRTVLLKNVKVTKNRKILRNCRRSQEMGDQTPKYNVNPRLDPGKERR